jgi:hypothetical protein
VALLGFLSLHTAAQIDHRLQGLPNIHPDIPDLSTGTVSLLAGILRTSIELLPGSAGHRPAPASPSHNE